MRTLLLILSSLMMCYTTSGQTRVIKGKVIGSQFPSKGDKTKHEFWALNEAIIFGNDSLRLGTTDEKGEFTLEIPENIQSLRIGWLGMYPEEFVLTDKCKFLEVILLPDAKYDFVTLKKEERLRKKDRKVLPDLYREASNQGIFKDEKPCR